MQIERERFWRPALRAQPVSAELRQCYKAKRIDTPAGTVTVNVPKTPDMMGNPSIPNHWNGIPVHPRCDAAVAEMYVKGVSTREVEAVMREFGIESLSSSQVSRAAKLIDDELEAWRNRLWAKSNTSSSTLVTRRCATQALSAMSLCSQPSASSRMNADAFSLCPSRTVRGRGALARLSRKPPEPWHPTPTLHWSAPYNKE